MATEKLKCYCKLKTNQFQNKIHRRKLSKHQTINSKFVNRLLLDEHRIGILCNLQCLGFWTQKFTAGEVKKNSQSRISTEKTTVKKSKKVARCFQNTSLYHYINYRLFASNSYVWECIFMKIMDYEVNGWIHCRICSNFLSFRPHQSLPCPYAQRLCSTTSRPPESGINGTNSPKFQQYMPKRIRKIVAWLDVKEFNDMSLGRILILQTGSFHLSKLQPPSKIHRKCDSLYEVRLSTLVLALLEDHLSFFSKPWHTETWTS